MVQIEDIKIIESKNTIQEAREATLQILFRGLTIADRRAQLRQQVSGMGLKSQLVQLAWTLMLNQQGFRDGQPLVKSTKGSAYKR